MDIKQLHKHFLSSKGVCTDTRKIEEGCIFFALKGENFDGNSFTQEALTNGAKMVVIDDQDYEIPNKTFLCKNVLHTLQQLATYHRNYLKIPIVSLTGSNGKTTTKELIQVVLSKKYNSIATKGNLNNHIGVPLTLLTFTKETEIGIIEMGANHQGEIAVLSEIAQPDYGYITNFGKAHLEGFGGFQGVIKGKTELYTFLLNNHKIVFVNGNDPRQLELSEHLKRIVFNGNSKDYQIQLLNATNQVSVKFNKTEVQTHLIGAYNFSNIAAAIAIGLYFKISDKDIKIALENYIPSMNRSQVIEKNENHIILDAYNANPTSMEAALHNFKNINATSKICILGDMFELGAEAEKEHQAIVESLNSSSFKEIFLVGENFFKTTCTQTNIKKFATFEIFKKYIEKNPILKSHLLIKGSRGMALERILQVL